MSFSGLISHFSGSPKGFTGSFAFIKDEKDIPGIAGFWHIIALGLSLVLAGQFTYWQAGMAIGAYEYILGVFVFFILYLCMAFCMAEMYSVLPFSGGLYGFVRVTHGPFSGCMVGYAQLLQNVLYMVVCVHTMSTYTSILLDTADKYTVAFCVMYLVIVWAVSVWLGRTGIYTITPLLTIVCIVFLLIYIFGAFSLSHSSGNMQAASFEREGRGDWFEGLVYASWFFTGWEMVPVVCMDLKGEPKRLLPLALPLIPPLLLLTAILLVFSTSTAGGLDSSDIQDNYYITDSSAALTPAYARILQISQPGTLLLALLPLGVCAYSTLFALSRQGGALGASSLIPRAFTYTYTYTSTSHSSHASTPAPIAVGSLTCFTAVCMALLVGLCIALASLGKKDGNDIVQGIMLLSRLCAYFCGWFQFNGYLSMRRKFAGLPKAYRSPLGTPGAYLGMGLCVCVAVSTAWFGLSGQLRGASWVGWAVAGVFLAVLLGWAGVYGRYVVGVQGLGEEEQRVMFVAYVINANRRAKLRYQVRRSSEMGGLGVSSMVLPMLTGSSKKNSRRLSRSSECSDGPPLVEDTRSFRQSVYAILSSTSGRHVGTGRGSFNAGEGEVQNAGGAGTGKVIHRINTASTFETSGRAPHTPVRAHANTNTITSNTHNLMEESNPNTSENIMVTPSRPLSALASSSAFTITASAGGVDVDVGSSIASLSMVQPQHNVAALDLVMAITSLSSPPSADDGDVRGRLGQKAMSLELLEVGEGADVVVPGEREQGVDVDADDTPRPISTPPPVISEDIFNVEDNKHFHTHTSSRRVHPFHATATGFPSAQQHSFTQGQGTTQSQSRNRVLRTVRGAMRFGWGGRHSRSNANSNANSGDGDADVLGEDGAVFSPPRTPNAMPTMQRADSMDRQHHSPVLLRPSPGADDASRAHAGVSALSRKLVKLTKHILPSFVRQDEVFDCYTSELVQSVLDERGSAWEGLAAMSSGGDGDNGTSLLPDANSLGNSGVGMRGEEGGVQNFLERVFSGDRHSRDSADGVDARGLAVGQAGNSDDVFTPRLEASRALTQTLLFAPNAHSRAEVYLQDERPSSSSLFVSRKKPA